MSHSHQSSEGHHHHHHHDAEGNLAKAFWLNFCFTLIEIVGGLMTGSTAILSDAIHDLGDSLALAIAWVMQRLSKKPSDAAFTYGYKRLSTLAALVNASVLIVGSIWIVVSASSQFGGEHELNGLGMLLLAIVGVSVNGYAALRVLSHQGGLNEQVAKWHLLEDALGWAAVLVGSIVILLTGWTWIDPLMAIVIALFVAWQAGRSWIRAVRVLLQATPAQYDLETIEQLFEEDNDIEEVHDLQLWSLDGDDHVLSVHLIVCAQLSIEEYAGLKERLRSKLAQQGIGHTTIEIELKGEACRNMSSH